MSKCLHEICIFSNMGWTPPSLLNNVKKTWTTLPTWTTLTFITCLEGRFQEVFRNSYLRKLQIVWSDKMQNWREKWSTTIICKKNCPERQLTKKLSKTTTFNVCKRWSTTKSLQNNDSKHDNWQIKVDRNDNVQNLTRICRKVAQIDNL